MRYILASGSPRRVELIQKINLPFEIMQAKGEEKSSETDPAKYAMEIAHQKALEVFERTEDLGKRFVLGADTVVVCDGQILGKPHGEKEAECMLRQLSGRTHSVYTGVSFIYTPLNDSKLSQMEQSNYHSIISGSNSEILHEFVCFDFYDKTDVTFNSITDMDIKRYVATRDPLDKAGGYGIQGNFSIHVSSINGNYENVIGLPVAKIYEKLRTIELGHDRAKFDFIDTYDYKAHKQREQDKLQEEIDWLLNDAKYTEEELNGKIPK